MLCRIRHVRVTATLRVLSCTTNMARHGGLEAHADHWHWKVSHSRESGIPTQKWEAIWNQHVEKENQDGHAYLVINPQIKKPNQETCIWLRQVKTMMALDGGVRRQDTKAMQLTRCQRQVLQQ